jgi:hypothetical protein
MFEKLLHKLIVLIWQQEKISLNWHNQRVTQERAILWTSGYQTFRLAAPLKRPKIFRGTPKYVKKN